MQKKINWFNLFLYATVVLLATQVYFLSMENRSLKAGGEMKSLTAVASGVQFAGMPVASLDGQEQTLVFDQPDAKKLLFLFSTNCQYCTENIVNWEALIASHSSRVELLAISENSVEETHIYQQDNSFPGEILVALPDDYRERYDVMAVPQTVLLNRDGIVEKAWLGRLNGEQLEDIATHINDADKPIADHLSK